MNLSIFRVWLNGYFSQWVSQGFGRLIGRSFDQRLDRWITKSLLLCLLVFSTTIQATTLKHLYEVSIPVYSQTDVERKAATKKAFEELLIRITGQRDIVGLAATQALLSKARRYVRSFRYELLPPKMEFEKISTSLSGTSTRFTDASAPADIDDENDEVLPTQQIVVSFDEAAVKESLWKHQLPVWGKTRPQTLVWIAIQNNEQRKMLDASQMTEILALMKEHAKKRGVPLMFPQLDRQDRINVNVTDVWGEYKEAVTNASLRYSADAVISAKLYLDSNGTWQTRWQLYQTNDDSSWQISAPLLSVVIYESIDKLARNLSARYAQVSGGIDENRFYINISEVFNLADYEKINQYLKSLTSIRRVDLAQIQNTELIYELELRSNTKALKQAIALGKILSTQDDPFTLEVDSNRLNYRLNP